MSSMGKEDGKIRTGKELRAWLVQNGKDRGWLAAQTGRSKSAVNKWCVSEVLPTHVQVLLDHLPLRNIFPKDLFEIYDLIGVAVPKEFRSRMKDAAELQNKSESEWIMDLIIKNCSIIPNFQNEVDDYDHSSSSDENDSL